MSASATEQARVWRVGVAGLGTVGAGLLQLLLERPDFAPAGGRAVVTAVSARDRTRDRGVDLAGLAWFDDPVALAASDDIDLFVELMGGAGDPAHAAVRAALESGKPVVTANKALIAEHGLELGRLAEARSVPLLFEAAVMGGAPAVKLLRECLVSDRVARVSGILNGTCNFILTEMERSERAFGDVLREAQALGYAEADPTTDVGGFDAAHKISLLAALAFGCAPNLQAAQVEGIEAVELLDIKRARDLGYRIKLIAEAVEDDVGVTVSVRPMLAPLSHPLAQTAGALNALFVEGRRTGRLFLQGAGAGAGPTAAAVAADIADVLAGARRPVFQAPAERLAPFSAVDADHRVGKAYFRLRVKDQPGVIAAVSEALAEAGLSIDSFLQKPAEEEGAAGVPIVLITHEASEAQLADAVARMAALPAVLEPPRMMRLARL